MRNKINTNYNIKKLHKWPVFLDERVYTNL